MKASRRSPSDEVDEASGIDEVTSLFAKQNIHNLPTERFQDVTPEERSQALCDLHAVPELSPEDPAVVLQKLDDLANALMLISENRAAYDLAVQQASNYVDSWNLRFLRAERFDPKLAAQRMIRYFEAKQAMFGVSSLGRDLSLDDLSPSEFEELKTGSFQMLPQRDRGGRPICIQMGIHDFPCSITTMLKIQFLMVGLASEDTDIQKRGIIAVFYAVGRTTHSAERGLKAAAFWSTLPLRMSGLHSCYDNPAYHETMTLVSHAMPSSSMCRLRCHYGSHVACQSNLAAFGIPKKSVPLLPDGSIDCTHHHQWIVQESQREKQVQTITRSPTKEPEIVDCTLEVIDMPGPKDVIMGRGQRKHPGNIRLRKFLKQRIDLYEKEGWVHKRDFCTQLLGQLRATGTRFVDLTEDGTKWERIMDEVAVEKIAHVFRDLRREIRRSSDILRVPAEEQDGV